MRSNWSKMWTENEMEAEISEASSRETYFTRAKLDPDIERPWTAKDDSGKVIKSPSYSPANLQPIIDSL